MCLKNVKGIYTGCVIGENFEWKCQIDDRCSRKYLDAKLEEEINVLKDAENRINESNIKEKINRLSKIREDAKSKPVKDTIEQLKLEELKHLDINEIEAEKIPKTESEETFSQNIAGNETTANALNANVIRTSLLTSREGENLTISSATGSVIIRLG